VIYPTFMTQALFGEGYPQPKAWGDRKPDSFEDRRATEDQGPCRDGLFKVGG